MVIRPKTFDDFHGQKDLVDYLRVAVKAASLRKITFGHTLFVGPAGLGKTTLATSVIPTELQQSVRTINCSAIDKPQAFTAVVSTMREGEVLFLDEVHMLPPFAREHLLSVMEDNKLYVSLEGTDATNVIAVELKPFTVIGATTRQGVLDAPLRTRFKHVLRLQPYDDSEMAEVATWVANSKGVTLVEDAQAPLINVARGTPRIIVNLIDACIDSYVVAHEKVMGDSAPIIEKSIALVTLDRLGYVLGFCADEWHYLEYVFQHGPCSLKTIASALDEQPRTVEEIYEAPFIQRGYLKITTQGRVLTDCGSEVVHKRRVDACIDKMELK
jgi:Holliday junction DNA helicase RuvB